MRKRLHFAREKFTDLLVAEVARSLENPAEELAQELIDVGLLDYCRAALARRSRGGILIVAKANGDEASREARSSAA